MSEIGHMNITSVVDSIFRTVKGIFVSFAVIRIIKNTAAGIKNITV